MKRNPDEDANAELSADRAYRYSLWRRTWPG